ncbi:10225_t:CDS:1 [Paraglomus brasilianum]|uniref:10225_t:CDS:1 n=1 Tax=Paraglomus brasilianum TaxID=144538 RepID=A0A9N9B0M5_9GLOM|nr:10225_t:CDS:1 [Paraglomus brasilianum]
MALKHPHLTIVKANAEQTKITNRNSFVEWGKGLSLDQYFERETILANLDFTRDNFIVWVLVPKEDPNTLDIISSCETFRRTAFVTISPGVIEEHICYSIASVFTPPSNRNNSYASTMLLLLSNKLKEQGASFSFLYSDVGPVFYRRLGWQVYSHTEIRLDVSKPIEYEGNVTLTPIKYNDIKHIAEKDCGLLKLEMRYTGQRAMAVVPSASCIEWMDMRAKYFANACDIDEPTEWGTVVSSRDDSLEFVLWCHEFNEKELLVLRLRTDGSNHQVTRALLRQAQTEALKHNLDKVIIWNKNIADVLNKDEIEIVERERSLPSLAWYHDNSGDIEWLLNEKYAWC